MGNGSSSCFSLDSPIFGVTPPSMPRRWHLLHSAYLRSKLASATLICGKTGLIWATSYANPSSVHSSANDADEDFAT